MSEERDFWRKARKANNGKEQTALGKIIDDAKTRARVRRADKKFLKSQKEKSS